MGAAGPSAAATFWPTQRQRTGQRTAQGLFWRTQRASAGSRQGDVSFDVRNFVDHGVELMAAAMLKLNPRTFSGSRSEGDGGACTKPMKKQPIETGGRVR